MVTDGLQFWECVKGTIFFSKNCRLSLIGSRCPWNYVKMYCRDFSKHYPDHLIRQFFGATLTSIDSKLFKEALNCRKI